MKKGPILQNQLILQNFFVTMALISLIEAATYVQYVTDYTYKCRETHEFFRRPCMQI